MLKLVGEVQTWDLAGDGVKARHYIVVNSNYGKVRKICRAEIFDEATATGEQRVAHKSHVNYLKQEMINGTFTPVSQSCTVIEHNVVRNGKMATVEIPEDNLMPLLNGNHRNTGLEDIRKESPRMQRLVDNLPITCMVYLENKRMMDFINLNKNRQIDSSHMMTLKIQAGLTDEKKRPYLELGYAIGKLLHTNSASPLYRLVKFSSGNQSPLGIKPLLTEGSDLAFSLFGSAKIAKSFDKDAEWMAGIISDCYNIIRLKTPELLAKGFVLSPPPDGTNGGASLLVGIGNMVAYHLKLTGRDKMTKLDVENLVDSLEVFRVKVDKNMSNPRKRDLMREFAGFLFDEYLQESDTIGGHEGIPIPLLLLLNCGSFNINKLDKPKEIKVKEEESVFEDADGLVLASKLDSDTDEFFE